MDDDVGELWTLLEQHARLMTSIEALQSKVPAAGEVRRVLAIKILEEQLLRKHLVDVRPNTNFEAQFKLIYLSVILAKTRTSMHERTIAQVMRSIDLFL
jgi:hypothetical protein